MVATKDGVNMIPGTGSTRYHLNMLGQISEGKEWIQTNAVPSLTWNSTHCHHVISCSELCISECFSSSKKWKKYYLVVDDITKMMNLSKIMIIKFCYNMWYNFFWFLMNRNRQRHKTVTDATLNNTVHFIKHIALH